jgi:tetratricopeptide (TPR) repeat protein
MAFAVVAPVGVDGQRVAAAGIFWEHVAETPRAKCDRLVSEAESVLGAMPAGAPAPEEKLARAQALVEQALAAVPEDYRALLALGELNARAARPAEMIAALERACPRAPRGPAASSCWFQLGVARSRAARFADALVAYERLISLADADAAAYANTAELLMVLGRLPEAEARYREAIELDTPASGRIENPYGLALSTYGLAVALDRDDERDAAREMMARALTLDPRHAKLTAAEQAGADVFFIPEGDVYYYLGLASELGGHVDDAEAAFQEFLARLPRSPWAGRARAHLETLTALERASSRTPAAAPTSTVPTLRVVAAGTVLASGPVPAPLVDAAWRERPRLVDDCLDAAVRAGRLTPRDGFRFAVELELDARGVVTEAVVKAPAPLDAAFSRCVEMSVRAGLRVPRPRRAHPTHARVELLVGLASGDAGGV